MRAATAIILILISSTTVVAQTRGGMTHDLPGHEFGGTRTLPGLENPLPEIPQTLEIPPIEKQPEISIIPSDGGGGGDHGPPHAHPGHAHSHCKEEWVCGQYHFEANDNYSVGSYVDGLEFNGRWVEGPCLKDKRC